jgi:O-antigen/teichoic acid export membrane protein
MLSHGFDLIFANIFVGAAAMGTFSLSKTLSMMVLGLFGSFSGNFSPELTELYAQNRINELIAELQKSIKLLSCFSTPILCALYIFTGDFFKLWLPQQDHQFLYLLATLGFLASPFTLPYEGLWNIFTLTNKLKVSSLTLFAESICVFTTVLTSMLLIKDVHMRLIVLAGSRTAWGALRCSLFLPMYGAHCLNIKLTTFYRYVLKALFCLVLSCFICYVLKQYININNWFLLIIAVGTCCIISFAINFFFVLDKDDKRFLITTLKNKIPKI